MDKQVQDTKDLFLGTAPGTEGSNVKSKQISKTKLVFEDSSEDEDEREKRFAAATLIAQNQANAVQGGLSTNREDYQDPLETAKLQGTLEASGDDDLFVDARPITVSSKKRRKHSDDAVSISSSDLDASLDKKSGTDDAADDDQDFIFNSSSGDETGDFFEDANPEMKALLSGKRARGSGSIVKSRKVEIPSLFLMQPPVALGGAAVREYMRNHNKDGGGNHSFNPHERQKRARGILADDEGPFGEQNVDQQNSQQGEVEEEVVEEEEEAEVDPTLFKESAGYKLSLDVRDLEQNPPRSARGRGRGGGDFGRMKRWRDPEDANLKVDPELLPPEEEERRDGEEKDDTQDCGGDVEEEEGDEEEEDLDEELDDLALVASIEQLVAGCDGDPDDERFKEFKAFAKTEQEKLWSHEITPARFAVNMLPAVSRIRGVIKSKTRPPRADPIVINGVQMDI